jgi:hypothetical protein
MRELGWLPGWILWSEEGRGDILGSDASLSVGLAQAWGCDNGHNSSGYLLSAYGVPGPLCSSTC